MYKNYDQIKNFLNLKIDIFENQKPDSKLYAEILIIFHMEHCAGDLT
jgi:hypothetical protein